MIKNFNEHEGQQCKGHTNWMTACMYEDQKERDLLSKCLDNYI